MLSPEEFAALPLEYQQEILRRAERSNAPARKYHDTKHAKQAAWVRDPSRRKAALCARRAGKSNAACRWLAEGAEEDGTRTGLSLYIALRRTNARRTAWNRGFKLLNKQIGTAFTLGEPDGQLTVTHPNGHEVWLAGCNNAAEMEKFLGHAFKRVVIDECATLDPYLKPLINEVIWPTLMDCRGELALISNPGARPAGFWYDLTRGIKPGTDRWEHDGWSVHHWTALDNPYIANVEEELAEIRQMNGWGTDNPTYIRQYLGYWASDMGSLVYEFESPRNVFHELPPGGKWLYGLGIDIGFSDATAFVVVAWRPGDPDLYVVHAEKHPRWTPSRVAAHTMRLQQKFAPGFVVVDEGGIGKGYASEMRESFGIGCEPAKKTQKRAYQEFVNGDLASGVIKIHPSHARDLVNELSCLPWNDDRTEEDDRFDNHCADAFLYACRRVRLSYEPEIETEDYWDEEDWEEYRKFQKQKGGKWWTRNQIEVVTEAEFLREEREWFRAA